MKKLVIVIFSFFALTGCGNKTLHCSSVNDANEGLKITQNIIIRFQNKSMARMDLRIVQDLSDNYAEYADALGKSLKKEYAKYENKKGMNVSVVSENKKVILTLSADLNRMDDQTKNDFDIIGVGQNITDVKSSLEQQGYSCKEV